MENDFLKDLQKWTEESQKNITDSAKNISEELKEKEPLKTPFLDAIKLNTF